MEPLSRTPGTCEETDHVTVYLGCHVGDGAGLSYLGHQAGVVDNAALRLPQVGQGELKHQGTR